MTLILKSIQNYLNKTVLQLMENRLGKEEAKIFIIEKFLLTYSSNYILFFIFYI